jgi:dTDP-4-dehydrorhamnose reductase
LTFESVLITGGAGQLATDLGGALGGEGEVVRLSHSELDVTDGDALGRAIRDQRPALVLNCAAFHDVDRCEREMAAAFRVNVDAVKRLAEECDAVGATLVHFSTNYVFDGEREGAYCESDPPHPLSAYAITKLAGEHAALAYAPRALVVRTAGLYGAAGSAVKGGNFVQRMLRRARAGDAIRMVSDQRLNPTSTADLAPAVIAAAKAGGTGILHLTSSGSCSWLEFTLAILELAGVEAQVEAVATTVPPGGARRPLNGTLRSERAESLGVPPLRPWREALTDYVASLA